MKTEKDLSPSQRDAYLKALSALERDNHGLVVLLMKKVVQDEPEFLVGRKLLREAEVRKAGGGAKASFLGLSGGGLPSLGKSKAQRALASGDWKTAMAEAEEALESDPLGKQANEDLHNAAESVAKAEREQITKALEPYAKSSDEAKAEAEGKVQPARQRMRAFEAVARFALETIARDPKAAKARHNVGKYLEKIGELEEATKVYEELLKASPTDMEARESSKRVAAKRAVKGGNVKDSSFRDLVKQRDQTAGEKVVGATESAEELAHRVWVAHEAGTPDRESARKLADLYYNSEDYDKALEYYQYLSALAEGTDPGLLRKIGDTEVRRLNRLIADKEKQLESLSADGPAAAAIRAEIDELRRGKAEQMLGEARKRVERNPTDLQYRFELGEQLVLAGHYKDAIPELQKARSNPNTRTRALNLLGRCYTERGMLDLAAKTLTDAASEIPGMDGTKKDILYQLGLVYERMGDKDKSLDCMKQIYEVDYGYLDVAERVEASYTA